MNLMRVFVRVLVVAAVLTATATTAQAGTRHGAIDRYAQGYAVTEGWLLSQPPVRTGGNNRRALYTLTYLANPAPTAGHCFDPIIYVDSCPEKYYEDGGPFFMDVEAQVVKCGPGWFVVSTPLDRNNCTWYRLPKW